jgi:hypothetical protein
MVTATAERARQAALHPAGGGPADEISEASEGPRREAGENFVFGVPTRTADTLQRSNTRTTGCKNSTCKNSSALAKGLLPAPAPTPAAAKAAAATNQPHDEQEYQRPDRRVDDRRYDTNAKVNTELGQQPVADEGAYDPDEEIPNDSEPGASYDLARQPSRDETDQQYDKETLA